MKTAKAFLKETEGTKGKTLHVHGTYEDIGSGCHLQTIMTWLCWCPAEKNKLCCSNNPVNDILSWLPKTNYFTLIV